MLTFHILPVPLFIVRPLLTERVLFYPDVFFFSIACLSSVLVMVYIKLLSTLGREYYTDVAPCWSVVWRINNVSSILGGTIKKGTLATVAIKVL